MGRLTDHDVAAIKRARNAYVAAMKSEDWALVARSFAEDAVRIPPHEQPHQGREAIEAWLGGIEELNAYELTEDALDGDGNLAYVRGRYSITLRPAGAPGPVSDHGDFLEVWRREPDDVWRVTEAIWNTGIPLGG